MQIDLHYVLNERLFRSACGHTLGREDGETPQGNPMAGRWVLRGPTGSMIDYDQYRNDLEQKHNLTTHGDD